MSSVRSSILQTLNQRGALPVQEIARAIGLSKMATRYHLRLLARDKLIASQPASCHGVGRPCQLYALTDKADALLPQDYIELVEHLLDEMLRSLGEKETRALLRNAGRRVALAHAATSIQARLRRTARWLDRRGYSARGLRTDSQLALIVCHCPYRHAARRYPALCEMDRAMINSVLGAETRMTSCIATGRSECRFLVGTGEWKAEE